MPLYYDMTINGKPLANFGGASLQDYTVSAPAITTHDFQGINRTSWRLLKQEFGRRTIDIGIVFKGIDLETARLQMSAFNAECWGRVSIALPDGFIYDCRIDNMGEAVIAGDDGGDTAAQIQARYKFVGQQTKPLETVTIPAGGGTLLCKSTMPLTDCRLTTTVGANASSYSFGGALWANVQAGDVLVFDGIDGLILRNGVNDATNVSWTVFPSLTAGLNTITATDAVTVEYFPTFI
jgi:hypothetical protein